MTIFLIFFCVLQFILTLCVAVILCSIHKRMSVLLQILKSPQFELVPVKMADGSFFEERQIQ